MHAGGEHFTSCIPTLSNILLIGFCNSSYSSSQAFAFGDCGQSEVAITLLCLDLRSFIGFV